MPESLPPNGTSLPRPDPTTLTTDVVNAAKEDLRRELQALREVLITSLAALRTEAMSEVRRVNDVTDQKFDAVRQQFTERDTRTEQAAQESRISLDAALAAAKEAVGEQNKSNAQSILKSEVATQKQIDSLVTLMSTSIKAAEDKIADLKSRLDRGESGDAGRAEVRTEHRLNLGQVIAGASVGLLAIAIVASTLIAVFHH